MQNRPRLCLVVVCYGHKGLLRPDMGKVRQSVKIINSLQGSGDARIPTSSRAASRDDGVEPPSATVRPLLGNVDA